MAFKKEIIPLIASLKRQSQFDAHACFIDDAVGKVFLSNEKSIFSHPDILEGKSFDEMQDTVRAIETSLLKVEGLRWLRHKIDRKGFSTAEKGE
jgi:hypothetical protein